VESFALAGTGEDSAEDKGRDSAARYSSQRNIDRFFLLNLKFLPTSTSEIGLQLAES
jgi:hypothetical protein